MRRVGPTRAERRRGRQIPVSMFVRGVLAWPLYLVGGGILWAAFKLSGESVN